MNFFYCFIVLLITKCIGACAEVRKESFENGNYEVEWRVDRLANEIYFNITVQTTGFVGIGINSVNGMGGADIFIGGVNDDSSLYFGDYHAEKNGAPTLDLLQNWSLISGSELNGVTNLIISRILDTCDSEDVAITNNTQYIIWSYGTLDIISYHDIHRGGVQSNILDPSLPPVDNSKLEKWELTNRMVMPQSSTSYWCSVHKQPKLELIHNIVGFAPRLNSPEALRHVHHFLLHVCEAPAGEDPDNYFEKYLNTTGAECIAENSEIIPIYDCSKSILYVWANGGKDFFFPENVGYIMNEDPSVSKYVMFEVHYDNPQELSEVEFEAGIDILHTAELREHEAAIMLISHAIQPTHIIPPKTKNYTTVGHCSPSCTSERLPESGIKIFNVLLHSHVSGRKLKLRHFRGNKELPWISYDDSYNFDYQQNRPLVEEITIMPGDQLAYECTADNTWTNVTVLAGLSTRNEMCESFSWYYPKQKFYGCVSAYDDFYKILNMYGMRNVSYESDYLDPTVNDPPQFAGMKFSEVLNEINWTDKMRSELENELRFSEHVSFCSNVDFRTKNVRNLNTEAKSKEDIMITYPEGLQEYVPENKCLI